MNSSDRLLVERELDDTKVRLKEKIQVRHIGLIDGIALVLGIQIGSGLFSSPSLVVRDTGSEHVALLVWIVAGLLVWTCAAGYIELGIRVPHNGGSQEYLSYCFNDTVGFIASWATIFIIKPCSTAMLALVISEYICNALHAIWARSNDYEHPLALILVIFVAALNCFSNRASDVTTKTALVSKILGISTIILAGFGTLLSRGGFPQADSRHETPPMQRHLSNYADAALAAMWAYSGWETLSFVGGELKEPSRNTSRVINISMTVVLLLCCLINLAYFAVLPLADIASSNTIALTFSERVFGPSGALFYSVMVSLATFGTLNGKTFVAGRLTQAAAERKYLPAFLKKLNIPASARHTKPGLLDRESQSLQDQELSILKREGFVPLRAIVFNASLTAIYIWFGSFEPLVTFIGVAECSVTFTALIGLLFLRHRLRFHPRLKVRSETESSPPPPPPSVHFQPPAIFIVLAIIASGVVVVASVAKHPTTLIGIVAFCLVSAAIHRFVIS